jgi:hypothetical protein
MGTVGGNLMQTTLFFYFLTSFQFHKKEIFPREHGNIGDIGVGGGPYANNILFLFISSLLSNFIKKNLKISWEHGNIGDICTFSGPDSKHKKLSNYLKPVPKNFIQRYSFLYRCSFYRFCLSCSSNVSSHNKHNPEPVPDYWVLLT